MSSCPDSDSRRDLTGRLQHICEESLVIRDSQHKDNLDVSLRDASFQPFV
jgi:hypothetical protein